MTKLYDDPRLHQAAAWIADQLPVLYRQDDLDRLIDLADAQFDLGLSGAAAAVLVQLVEQLRRTPSNDDHTRDDHTRALLAALQHDPATIDQASAPRATNLVWLVTVIRPGEDDLYTASLDRDAAIAWANLKISPSAKLVRTRDFGNALVLTRLDDDRYQAIITCLWTLQDS